MKGFLREFGHDKVWAVGLGTGNNIFDKVSKSHDEHLVRVVQCALDLGISFIDCAEIYSSGHAEEIIGRAIRGKRKKAFIASKFSPENSSYRKVLKAAEGSLIRLKTDYIDLYQNHWPNWDVPFEETLAAIYDLKKSGKIRYIGLCNLSLKQFKQAQKILPGSMIWSLQTEYNLLERSCEKEVLPYMQKNNKVLLAYSPFAFGSIFKDSRVTELAKIAKKYQRTVAQIVLNFLISHKNVLAICSTTNLRHLHENKEGLNFNLSAFDINLIDKLFKPKIVNILPSMISTSGRGYYGYVTSKEAVENKLNFSPSPVTLAREITDEGVLKPVRVKIVREKSSKHKYVLVAGRIRYWAWVIAFGNKPIPTIVEDTN